MMRTVIFGAAGNIGSAVAAEAVSRGHEATAVVRGPDRPTPAGTTPAYGDVADSDQVKALLKGHHAAVGALRAPAGDKGLQDEMTEALLEGAAAAGARLLLVGGAATLTVPDGGRQVLDDERYLPPAYRADAEASARQHRRCLEEKDADWTYLSPPALIDAGERTGRYRVGRDELLVDAEGVSRISVADLAAAIVDELERPSRRRTRFTVAAA